VRFRFDDNRRHVFCWFEGVTQDISGGGLQITVDCSGIEAIVRRDLLDLELYLPRSAAGQSDWSGSEGLHLTIRCSILLSSLACSLRASVPATAAE